MPTLGYEALFEDIAGSLRQVCAFLGVPCSARMLDDHLNTTYGPPDASLTWQWRRSMTPGEIAMVKRRAGALIRARGYQTVGPDWAPGPVNRFAMAVANNVRVWRFGVRRPDFATFFSEILARRLGLERMRRRLERRMIETACLHLEYVQRANPRKYNHNCF